MTVFIKGRSGDKATLLLAAAEELDLGPSVVRTTSKGYLVPEEVAEKADLGGEGEQERKQPAKSASKKEWAEFAGLSEEEADGMTRDQIIEKYGKE